MPEYVHFWEITRVIFDLQTCHLYQNVGICNAHPIMSTQIEKMTIFGIKSHLVHTVTIYGQNWLREKLENVHAHICAKFKDITCVRCSVCTSWTSLSRIYAQIWARSFAATENLAKLWGKESWILSRWTIWRQLCWNVSMRLRDMGHSFLMNESLIKR